jgi:dihydroneopterin aldolase
MSGHFTIELKGLKFFADHGLYEEEARIGNQFEVDITLECQAPEHIVTSIDETINYVEVYRITEEVFKVRKRLLETAVMEIAEKLQARFPELEKLTISIRKLNPPITNFTGSVGVVYSKTFTT